VCSYDDRVLRVLLWGLLATVLGIVLGVVGGLLRRRPVPDTVSYVAPPPASGPTAVGPHRAVLRA
jgi:uncharacterized membrane protein